MLGRARRAQYSLPEVPAKGRYGQRQITVELVCIVWNAISNFSGNETQQMVPQCVRSTRKYN